MSVHPRETPVPRWVLTSLWVGAVAVVALLVRRFWIPLDDGTLGQSAERVLGGELPHRDFGDPYTGLNAFLGALAFRLFGVSLASLRIPLVVGFALWLPALWKVARRFASPGVALLATALAGALSVLAYPAAMPTWFGLYAVTWGLVALLAHVDDGRRRWLALAGAAAGVALLFKVVGLYFLAAALLTVAWTRSEHSPASRFTNAAGVALFLLLLGRMVLPRTSPAGVYHFFLPALALGLVIALRPWTPSDSGTGPSAGRGVGPLLLDGVVLGAGALAPVLLYLVPYVGTGSVGAWVEGVFLLPTRRFAAAASLPAAPWTVLPGILAVGILMAGSRLSPTRSRHAAIGLLALLAAGMAMDDRLGGGALSAFWYSARTWIPALTVAAAWRWMASRRRKGDPSDGAPARSQGAHLAVVATAALWSLVLFPYSSPAYFFYVAPLVVLATLAVLNAWGARAGPVAAVLAGLYAFLGLGYVAGVAGTGERTLDLDRGGIRVAEADATRYARLVEVIEARHGGRDIWAGPDAPEVYFLSGRPNPTPTLYEFLTPRFEAPGELERFLDAQSISMVVINTRPLFSAALPDDVLRRLAETFPEEEAIDPFLVRWRSP